MNRVQLTDSSEAEGFPAWSPDGSMIVFEWNRMSIAVMHADGSGQRILSTPLASITTNSLYQDRHPRWSFDGSMVVFETNRNGNWDICVMRDDGSGQMVLTNSPADDRFPSWSPSLR